LSGGSASCVSTSLPAGQDVITASYSGDGDYSPVTSQPETAAVTAETPAMIVTCSAASITTAQSLSITAFLKGGGSLAPTGPVSVSSGGYASPPSAVVDGVATIVVPPGSLTMGNDALLVTYTPDASSAPRYTGAASFLAVTVTSAIGTTSSKVTVTASEVRLLSQQSDTMTITVAGGAGQGTPTGTVTLTAGSFNAQQPLVNGATSFLIPGGTLGMGGNTITASYLGDGTYGASTGTATVTVCHFLFDIPSLPPLSAGAGTTVHVTVLTDIGYSGTINLTCALTGSPAGAQSQPTCGLNPSSVTIPPGGAGLTVLTVLTTAASSTALVSPIGGRPWGIGSGGATLAALLSFGLFSLRRRWISIRILTCAIAFAGLIGCGGIGSSNFTPPSTPATTSGTYTFKLTGTDSSGTDISNSASFTLTVPGQSHIKIAPVGGRGRRRPNRHA